MLIDPAPRRATVSFGLIKPGSASLADVSGRAWPVGQTVRNAFRLALSIVTFSTAEVALAGTGAVARLGAGVVNARSTCTPPCNGPAVAMPIGSRESKTRWGAIDTNTSPAGDCATDSC